jgi:hypothetical protein
MAGEEVAALDVRAMGEGVGRRVEPRQFPMVEAACGSCCPRRARGLTAAHGAPSP